MLGNYYALKDFDKVRIGWTTLAESNNSHFSLSRSQDGKNFVKLAKIDGSFYALSVKNYEFQDKTPIIGTNYYRLVQYDLNGDSTDYGIKAVKFNLDQNRFMRVYPNPSTGKFTIDLKNNSTAETTVLIQNLNGKTIYNQIIISQNGKIEIEIDAPTGYYTLKTISLNNQQVQKMLIK